jgi:hypothetical protein
MNCSKKRDRKRLRYCFAVYQDSLPLSVGGMHCINLYFECVARKVTSTISIPNQPTQAESREPIWRSSRSLFGTMKAWSTTGAAGH